MKDEFSLIYFAKIYNVAIISLFFSAFGIAKSSAWKNLRFNILSSTFTSSNKIN